ncbi:MAG: hypothetical protein ACHREM_22440 [Polyangiales bacterium]
MRSAVAWGGSKLGRGISALGTIAIVGWSTRCAVGAVDGAAPGTEPSRQDENIILKPRPLPVPPPPLVLQPVSCNWADTAATYPGCPADEQNVCTFEAELQNSGCVSGSGVVGYSINPIYWDEWFWALCPVTAKVTDLVAAGAKDPIIQARIGLVCPTSYSYLGPAYEAVIYDPRGCGSCAPPH